MLIIKTINNRCYKYIFIAIFIFSLQSCSSMNGWLGTKLGFDTDLSLSFKVDKNINPDDNKNPSPVFIRLYELKSSKIFNQIDFISLYERDVEVLGEDLINKQELKRLIPGHDRIDNLVLSKDTETIALFAEFLDYQGSKFKIVTSIVANNIASTSIAVKISGNRMSLLYGLGEDTAK